MRHEFNPQMTRLEKAPTRVYADAQTVSRVVAAEIAQLIRLKQARGERCVLGLATGSTPTGVYQELVRLHQHEGLSFRNVISFNLDEYFPMEPRELQSYHRFMREHLFDQPALQVGSRHQIQRRRLRFRASGTLLVMLVSLLTAPFGWVGVVLDTQPPWGVVAGLLEQAFRQVATAKLVAQLDESG